MFGTIRKHQQWLWALIIAATIVSFVAFFNPAQNSLSGLTGGGASFGTIYGQPISRDLLSSSARQAELIGRLRFGEAAGSAQARQMGFDVTSLTYQRLFFAAKLRQLGIVASDEAVADWIRQNLPKDPKTGALNYDAFIENNVKRWRFTEADFHDFARQEAGMRQLRDAIGVGGQLVTPREAEAEFRRENEQTIARAVFFAASNYLAKVEVNPVALAQFFTNRIAEYRIPERTVISYVRWDSASYLTNAETEVAKLPDLAKRIASVYDERGADAFKDKEGKTLGKEAALAEIRKQAIEGKALEMAARAARDFANELYAIEPAKPGNLDVVAAKYGLAVRVSQPFSEFGSAPGLEDAPELVREAARLTAEQPFSKPVETAQGVYLAALQRKVPSEVPGFESVRARVTADFRRVQSQEAARSAGEAFAATVAQGKPFAEAAAAQNLRVADLAPFSIATQSLPDLDARVSLSLIKDAAFSLKPGTAGKFVPSSDGGFVLFVKERKPVDDALVKAGLNSYLDERRHQHQEEVFERWFQSEFQKSGLAAILKKKGDPSEQSF
jgi:SurA N-terminal domain/PPIC-type PPIASE domain